MNEEPILFLDFGHSYQTTDGGPFLVDAAWQEMFGDLFAVSGPRSYAVTHPDHPGEIGEVTGIEMDPSEGFSDS